jgi:ABC-type transporter Mla MlaB component
VTQAAGHSAPAVGASPEASPSADASKEALRVMLERKRHNDTIREREFNALRKLLKDSASSKAAVSEEDSILREVTQYSDFGERAQTLKKIDDIEAQMSRQWWKVRSGPTSAQTPLETTGLSMPMQTAPGWALDAQDSFPPTLALTKPDDGTLGLEFDGLGGSSGFDGSEHSAFSESKMVSVERGQTLSDPVLADVAVRFANGDDAGTERVLLDALRGPQSRPETVEPWAGALFDFYRSVQKQAEFEAFAQEHAARFGRQPPRWEALAPLLGDAPDTVGPQEALTTLPVESHSVLERALDANGGPDTRPSRHSALAKPHFALSGQLLGDCDALLLDFQARHAGVDRLVVSCAHLMRVDFAAAGSMLNWAAGAKAAGIEVELRKVSRLVASFFILIGINEYALIRSRSD